MKSRSNTIPFHEPLVQLERNPSYCQSGGISLPHQLVHLSSHRSTRANINYLSPNHFHPTLVQRFPPSTRGSEPFGDAGSTKKFVLVDERPFTIFFIEYASWAGGKAFVGDVDMSTRVDQASSTTPQRSRYRVLDSERVCTATCSM